MSLSAVNAARGRAGPPGRIAPGQRHPLVDAYQPPSTSCSSTGSSSSASALDRKPTLPRLMPEDRDVDLGDRLGGPQERPVAAEHDQDVGRAAAPPRAPRSRRPAPPTGRCRGCGTSRRRARRARRRPRSWGCRRSRGGGRSRARRPRRPRPRRRSARPGPRTTARARTRRGTRGCPPGPGSATAITSRVPSPSARRVAVVSRRTRRWTSRSRTTPPCASARPASNWGLTSATIVPGLAQHGPDRAQDEPERDERDVDHGEVRGLRQRVRGQRPRVDPLHRDHPRSSARSRSASWP